MKLAGLCVLAWVLITGCVPLTYPPGEKTAPAHLAKGMYITEDGAHLPVRQWLPDGDVQAVVIALHGFNDYSHFFQQPGDYLKTQGIASFAYDQRGFGLAPQRRLWAGLGAYTADVNQLVALLKQRYPNRPIYLLGESMGAAVIMAAMSQTPKPEVAGIILSSPALWARSTMPWYQSGLLWLLAHSVPWLSLTGEGVKVTPSDNIPMLRALGKDPLVIKGSRVETLYGLTDLMDAAYASAPLLNGNSLLLYGERDDIIPKPPTYAFLQRFLAQQRSQKTVAFYQHGYHLLLRDLQAKSVWQDIVAWIRQPTNALPSGAGLRAGQVLQTLQ